MQNVVTSKFKIFFHRKTRCRNTIFSPKTRGLSSTKLVFQNPVLRINHGVNNDVSTVLLSSYNKQNNNNRTKQTHTRTHTRDPRRRQTSHDWSQHENKGQLFQLIRTFMEKVSVWEETKNESASLMQFSNSKLLQVTFTVTASEFKTFWMKIAHS